MKSLRFTEAVSLALHTMVLIARDPQTRWTTRKIAENLSVSANHLSKIHTRLVNEGLLNSVRGPMGGLSLARMSDRISLMEIYESIEGRIPLRGCLFGKPVCLNDRCLFGDFLNGLNEQVRMYLTNTRLSDLANPTDSHDPSTG
ncbi:Rrf2 family transcriptional regulator [bacterium]|nr:Rrf2 family transcriptional regulator [candidate division CSSED10-310 bacterium]